LHSFPDLTGADSHGAGLHFTCDGSTQVVLVGRSGRAVGFLPLLVAGQLGLFALIFPIWQGSDSPGGLHLNAWRRCGRPRGAVWPGSRTVGGLRGFGLFASILPNWQSWTCLGGLLRSPGPRYISTCAYRVDPPGRGRFLGVGGLAGLLPSDVCRGPASSRLPPEFSRYADKGKSHRILPFLSG